VSARRVARCAGTALAALGLLGAPRRALADEPQPSSTDEDEVYLDVTVEGDKAPPGSTTLKKKDIAETPGVLGDPYRAIEIEPGVTPVASGVPYYFIRGAPPGNTGYFFEGIRVPLLFHVGAGPGVINPGLVQSVELDMGPFPVSRGRYAGAIVDAEMIPPRDEWRGEGVFRTVDLGGLVEAPLPDRAGSVLVGGHYAVGAALLSALVPSVDLGYWDYQARGSFRAGDTGRFTVLAFGSRDYLATVDDDAEDVLLDSDFHRVDLRYDQELEGGGRIRASTTLGLDESRGAGVESAVDYQLSSRVVVEKPVSRRALLRAGLDFALDSYDVTPGGAQTCTTFICSGGLLGGDTERQLEEAFRVLFPDRVDLAASAFADAVIVLGDGATINPGLRLDYYASRGNTALGVDPRVIGRFAVGERLTLIPAVGVASQLPGFPPLPGLQIGGIPGGLQRAFESSFSAKLDVAPFDLEASVYRAATFNLTDALGTGRGTSFDAERFIGRSLGDSYGLELSARGALTRRIFFLASYTLSRTTRHRDGLVLPSAYDRTHVAQAALMFDLGKNWRAGARSVFYTGFPADEAGVGRTPSEHPDRVRPFYRLDLRVSKRWLWDGGRYVGLVFDFQNATLAKEIFDVTCDDAGCTPREIGPLTIPTLAFEAGF
jgi:hypothetical protein